MAKNGYGVATIIAIIALIVGGLLTYGLFPKTIVTEKIITKEVPVQKEVVVEKEVVKEIPLDIQATYLDSAVADFTAEIDNLEDELSECDEYDFDEDEIEVRKVYDGWNVLIDDEDYSVTFDAKLKYDNDDEEKCYRDVSVEVYYEPNEEPEVTIL